MIFFREYIGERIINTPISHPDMKTKYAIRITDLRHQPDHITSKRFQLFQKNDTDPDNPRMFLIIIKRREIESRSDGNKLTEFTVI